MLSDGYRTWLGFPPTSEHGSNRLPATCGHALATDAMQRTQIDRVGDWGMRKCRSTSTAKWKGKELGVCHMPLFATTAAVTAGRRGCAGGGQVGDFHVAPDLPWVRIGAEGVVHERHRYPTLLGQ